MENNIRMEGVDRLPWPHLRFPPFPQVALRVLRLANNENVPLHELCDLISSDPIFASEVLTIANSLLYAPRYPASGILQAIAVLGANHLQGMCLTVGMRAYLGKSLTYQSLRNLWRHNLACALIAEQIASAGFMDKDIAYTSGILHDIGRFALTVLRPKEYAALLADHNGNAESILESERALFGWDHCETAKQIMVDWRLPADYTFIVSEHHAPRLQDDSWSMAELIKVSCKMADSVGFAAFPGRVVTPFSDLLDELPARERKLFHREVGSLAREVANEINAVESV
jgi:HD-like signal output (HDOD) protein